MVWSYDRIPDRGRDKWAEASVGVGIHGPEEEVLSLVVMGWMKVNRDREVLRACVFQRGAAVCGVRERPVSTACCGRGG